MKTIERKTWLVYIASGGKWLLQERTNDPARLEELRAKAVKFKAGLKIKEAPVYLPDCRADKLGRVPQSDSWVEELDKIWNARPELFPDFETGPGDVENP